MADFDDGDGIQGAIEAAFEEHSGDAAPSAAAAPREALKPAADTESDAGDRLPLGRDDKPAPQTAAAKGAQPSKADSADETSWSSRNKETFARLPVGVQRQIQALEKENAGSAALKRDWAPVDKLFEPHRKAMADRGFTPEALIKGWSRAETRLLDPQDKAGMVAEIMHTYQINPSEVARALQDMPNRIAVAQQHRQVAAVQNVQTALDTFASARDRAGKPVYPHFKQLEGDMAMLARTGVGAGKPHAERLKELYDAALRSSPQHREAALEAAQAARNRARPNVSRPGGRASAPSVRPQTIRDAILAAMGETR